MSDFCLGSRTIASIERKSDLMDRTCARSGIAADAGRNADPALWYEARLRCLGCVSSQRCRRFLATLRVNGQPRVPDFCANRAFLAEHGRGPTQ
jgi:Family of unknown function (DUF6455)